MTKRVRYLSVLDFSDRWLAELCRRAPGVDVTQIAAAEVRDVPPEIWANVDVLHTAGLLPDPSQVPRLRWVQLDTSGVDHVLNSALWHSDVPMTTIGGVSPVPLAEYVLFAMLGLAHRLPAMQQLRRDRIWPSPQRRWLDYMPARVAGATVGIVGYGRIGREVGRLARGLNMNVIGLNRTGVAADPKRLAGLAMFGGACAGIADPLPEGVTLRPVSELPEAARECDYLVIVCPLTPQTRGLVDEVVLGSLRPGAMVVNVSRGGVLDEDALRSALRTGQVGGAALDVFAREPLPASDPWWDEPGILISPHSAGLSPRYEEHVLDLLTENLNRLSSGRPLLNLVDRVQAY